MSRLVALLLAVPAVVLAPSAVAADGLTCHGQTATIVGTAGGAVEGTDGSDVVVTEGALETRTLGGDDLVCVTGTEAVAVVVKTGEGDDGVDTTAVTWSVETGLGPGVDAFTGGAGPDAVDVGGGEELPETVSTGAGNDVVEAGRNGLPMNEHIDTGGEQDTVVLRGLPGNGSFTSGDDLKDTLVLSDRTRADWVVDNKAGVLRVGASTSTVDGFTWFALGDLRWSSLRFVGGALSERLDVVKLPSAHPDGPVRVSMGAGADFLTLGQALTGPYNGGAARDDHLVIVGNTRNGTRGYASVDLDASHATVNGGVPATVKSFGHVVLSGFARNWVQGDRSANNVDITGCQATVHGDEGRDLITFHNTPAGCITRLEEQYLTAYGDAGPDRLIGAGGDDFLIGGAGRDSAEGRGGEDVCSAETVSSC